MFGITTPQFNIRDAFSKTIKKFTEMAGNEIASKIPFYINARDLYLQNQAQTRKGPRTEGNTIRDKGWEKAVNRIKSEIAGTYNPIKWLWGLVKSLFGDSREARISNSIKDFEALAHLYDAYRFAPESTQLMTDLMEDRIAKLEGLFAKLTDSQSKSVVEDGVLGELRKSFDSWAHAYNTVLDGEVEERNSLSSQQINYLEKLDSRVRYGPIGKYFPDMADYVNNIVIKAKRQFSTNDNGNLSGREAGQVLSQQEA